MLAVALLGAALNVGCGDDYFVVQGATPGEGSRRRENSEKIRRPGNGASGRLADWWGRPACLTESRFPLSSGDGGGN
jgi:hypothetical protein